jgi:hypothetical protein
MAFHFRIVSTLAPALVAGLAAQNVSTDPSDIDKTIEDLQRISVELNQALKTLDAHLDDAVARYDSGYRVGRLHIPAADAELSAGDTNVKRADVRKLMLARLLAVRSPEYTPAPLADMDRLQNLILEARGRLEGSDPAAQRLLLVSAKDLSRQEGEQWKFKHERLLKARTAAESATRKAILALPIALPEADSSEGSKDRALELAVGSPADVANRDRGLSQAGSQEKKVKQDQLRSAAVTFPIQWERQRHITLVREQGYRIALTDPGIEDQNGRHIFYQEEWVQRGLFAVEMTRWRVAVDTATGQHTLVKRYRPRKQPGDIDDASDLWDRAYIWRLEPPDSPEPSPVEVESALSEVARHRELLRAAVEEYRNTVRTAMARNDRLQAAGNQVVPDAALAPQLREKLFAIRGHLGRTSAILEAEEKVDSALHDLSDSVQALEPLAAWANRSTLDEEKPSTKLAPSEWQTLQERSDDEIDLATDAKAEARTALPPDLSAADAKFPALQKDAIIHISAQPSREPANTPRCLQEIWRFGFPSRQGRRVERIVTLIAIDSKTGIQRVLGVGTQYYKVRPEDPLEEIFDAFGSEEVSLRSIQP